MAKFKFATGSYASQASCRLIGYNIGAKYCMTQKALKNQLTHGIILLL